MVLSWIHSLLAITTILPIYTNGVNEDSMVRLVNGTAPSKGRLEVFHNNTWGTVCGDFFAATEGRVVCRQLNYIGLVSVVSNPSVFGSGEGQIWLDDVHCNGSEDSILDCYHRGLGAHNCQHTEDVGIICDPSSRAEEGAVRLVGGNNHSSGRVEVFHNEEWVTVCDRGWDINDATVICRQLGFKGALSAPLRSQYGPGVSTTWLLNVQCSGSESRLIECDHDGWGTTWCYHLINDASVECEESVTATISPTTPPSFITTTNLVDVSTITPSHSVIPSKSASTSTLRHPNYTYTSQIMLPTHSTDQTFMSPLSMEFILGLVLILIILCSAVLMLLIVLVCIYRNRRSKSVRVEDLQQVFPATVYDLQEDQCEVVLTNTSVTAVS